MFASSILNTLFAVFEGCYREYLRVAEEFEKASESWLPLQFLLKERIKLDGLSKSSQDNICNYLGYFLKEKTEQQDKRDIEEMNDSLQQKRLYLKYLTPATQPELSKMEEEI